MRAVERVLRWRTVGFRLSVAGAVVALATLASPIAAYASGCLNG